MDIISLSQFQKATNEKNRTNLIYWLNYLVQAKILVKIKKSKYQVEYGFNKDYEQWLPLVQARSLVQVRSWGSASTDTETSASNDTYKRKKEITKENTATQALPFVWEEYLKGMENNKRLDLQLIAYYFQRRKLSFSSKAEAEVAIRRHLRAAKDVSVFEKPKVFKAMDECDWLEKQKGIKWSLETVSKFLTK